MAANKGLMFPFSKIMGQLLDPANLMLLGLLVGILLSFKRAFKLRRAGRYLAVTMACGLFLVSILPIGDWLLRPLENRFSVPLPMPEKIDGIIVLGGSIDPRLSADRHQVVLGGAAERLTVGIELSRRYPAARLIFSGGSGSVLHPAATEAPFAKTFFEGLGQDVRRVVFEGQSRNTFENAQFSAAQVRPQPDEVWLLVTSASHMPRAVGVFRHAGWSVVPYPVDFSTTKSGDMNFDLNLSGGLSRFSLATHEWYGLIYYRLMGWTDSWFPRPL